MPRQDVPYGGAICRLREKIAEIFDKLGEKLHTINGVPGDGDGNVKIVSGSSAVVISNDPTQNEIAVSLDTSQLPAASVSSVNGQTGAVALDAGDIPSDGNSDVQTDIDALQTMDGALQGNINAEALARQNADATLQTNINAATASIPGAAAAAVAADNTIVRTSGNQNIADIKTVATEATGTYSQQIANSQKVKAELDNYAPMMRLANNQQYTGVKTLFKTGALLPQLINITDYSPNLTEVYLSGIIGAGNKWIVNDRVGTDNNGNRGFYSKQYRLVMNGVEYVVTFRINITSTGLNIQYLDPVTNTWRKVVLS